MAVSENQPLTLPQVAEAVDVEYRTLHTWVKRGLLKPGFQASTGAGTPNLFTFQDAIKARILGDLRNAGIDLDLVERTAKGLCDLELEDDGVLLVNGKVQVLPGGADLDTALDEDRPSVVYRISWAADALREPA
jgi:DNA-binding transcriptional MerR regulator